MSISGSTFSALGVGSGLDFQSMIEGLVKIEGVQQAALKNRVSSHQQLITGYQSLNSTFKGIGTAADALKLAYSWRSKATSSSSSNVVASATATANSGTFSFRVASLATTEAKATIGTVSSADTVVGSGNLLLGIGGKLGLSSVTGNGLSVGDHSFEVTQASTGASISGTAIGDQVTLGVDSTIDVDVNGSTKSLVISAGTYTRSQLAEQFTNQSAGLVKGGINADGSLKLTSTDEGSAVAFSITGGTNLGSIGLSSTTAQAGTDGIIEVDGVANTVSLIRANGSSPVTLNSSAGTVEATFSRGLREGTSTFKNIDLGDGKLSTVANAINSANAGLNAAVVQTGTNQYKLQLQSKESGLDGTIATNFNAFSTALGQISTVTEAKDAKLLVGEGAAGYSVTSSSNKVADVLPGVTLDLKKADANELITVSVNANADDMANKVKSLIDNVNNALKTIKANSAFDPLAKKGGLFMGNFTVQNLQRKLASTFAQSFDSSSLATLSAAGIKFADDGTINFDSTKFKDAFAKDPQGVSSLFIDGGVNESTSGHKGLVEQLADVSKYATDITTGSLTTAINGENKTVTDLNKQIDKWTERIEAYRLSLRKQFAAVDTALANFKSQQANLTSAMSGLLGNRG